MRFVYVLEDDPKFLREITEAILFVDPKVQVRQFHKLEEFAEWIKVVMQDGRKAIIKGGKPPEGTPPSTGGDDIEKAVLQVVISKIEFLGARQLGLMKKTRELFIKHKICTAEDPTAFVLTAFEDPAFHIRELKDRILSNIILKPFDKLILQQHLTFALDGRHPPSKHAVAPYKTSAIIEVLKEVQMKSLSTIGFSSTSNRVITEGSIAKYYGKPFVSERQKSVIAKVVACSKTSNDPEEYRVTASFFGLDPTQIANIRRTVVENRSHKLMGSLSVQPKGKQQKVRIFFIEERDEVYSSIAPTLSRKIKGAELIRYRNTKDFFLELDPKLDTTPNIQPFSTGNSLQLNLDKIGRVLNWTQKDVLFLEKTLSNGFLLSNFLSDKEKIDFVGWLTKPVAAFVATWGQGDKSQIMKMTSSDGKAFLLEVANQNEREEYIKKNNKLLAGVDFLFLSHRFVDVERLEFWQEIIEKVSQLQGSKRPVTILLSSTQYSDSEERSLASTFSDLHFIPVERVYLLQKMLLHNQEMQILEDPIDPIEIPQVEIIKSAKPAPIEELSEAGLVMKYERQMSLGSFREFVLWQPYEVGAPEITATCNFAEPGASPEEWKLHFVFFAMKDILLKAIRNWIRENYILSKDKS